MPGWWLYIPGVLIAGAGVIVFRWLILLQRRITDQGERIARLEGRRDG